MALTTTEIQQQIDTLERALGDGALKVKYRDQEITYRSRQDMEASIARLQKKLDAANGTTRVSRIYVTSVGDK